MPLNFKSKRIKTLCNKGLKSLFFVVSGILLIFGFSEKVSAQGINPTFSFQTKIVNSDGTNIQNSNPSCVISGDDNDTCRITLSIYDATSTGTLLWTETHTNVEMGQTGGIINLQVGSINTLATSSLQNFNRDDLYLQVEFDKDGDGNMDETFAPRVHLSAVPYAYNSQYLGGMEAMDFVHLAPLASQTDSSTSSSIFINKTGGIGDFLQLQASGTDVFRIAINGDLYFGDNLYFGNSTSTYLAWNGSNFDISNHLYPTQDNIFELGSSTSRWKDVYVGSESIHIGEDGNEGTISYNTSTNSLVFNSGINENESLVLTNTVLKPAINHGLSLGEGGVEIPVNFDAENSDNIINGTNDNDTLGATVSIAGDINNDGYEDILVGANAAEDTGSDRGRAYIIYGSGSLLSSIDAENADVIINGTNDIDDLGYSVSGAGDTNNDGYDDIIIGADLAEDTGSNRGRVYIIYGSNNLPSSIDAENADVIINGTNDGDLLGSAVSKAGDINNDGFDDVLIGTYHAEDTGTNRGRAYIIYGSGSLSTSIDAENANVIINGTNDNDYFGYVVSNAGDINNDGFDDVIIGAHQATDTGTRRGRAYIIYGSGSLSTSIDAENADVIINGINDNDYFGYVVSSAGDINNDGFNDIAIGATGADVGGLNRGQAYIIYGSGTLPSTINAEDSNVIVNGTSNIDSLGNSISSIGDINNDSFDDLIIGAYMATDGGIGRGRVYAIYGSGTLPSTINAENADIIMNGTNDSDYFGVSVSGGGDINNDGRSDFVVGAYLASDVGTGRGRTYLFTFDSYPSVNEYLNIYGANIFASSQLTVSGNLNTANIFSLQNLYFGAATSTYLSYNGSNFVISDDLYPSLDNTFTLGSSTARWQHLYVGPGSIYIGDTTNQGIITYGTSTKSFNFDVNGDSVPELKLSSSGASFTGTTSSTFNNSLFVKSGSLGVGTTTAKTSMDVSGNALVTGMLYFDSNLDYGILYRGGGIIQVRGSLSPTNKYLSSNGRAGIDATCASGKALVGIQVEDGIIVAGTCEGGITPDVITEGADVAENYYLSGEAESGDILSIDTASDITIKRATSTYDMRLAGVVSTNPEMTLAGNLATGTVPVALNGRVPVKVSVINGNVKRGDLITSSILEGYGMKADGAGYTVGKALQSTEGWNDSSCTYVSNVGEIVWPADDGTNPSAPCYAVPVTSLSSDTQDILVMEYGIDTSDNIYVGKVMMLINVSYTQSQATLASIDNMINDYDAGLLGGSGGAWELSGNLLVSYKDLVANSFYANRADFTVLESGMLNVSDGKLIVDTDGNITSDGYILVGGNIRGKSGNVTVALGDNSGANSFKIVDSSDSEVLGVDSTGALSGKSFVKTGWIEVPANSSTDYVHNLNKDISMISVLKSDSVDGSNKTSAGLGSTYHYTMVDNNTIRLYNNTETTMYIQVSIIITR